MLPDGRLEPLSIGVKAGRIAVITDQALDADETLDVDGLTVAAGARRRAFPRLLGLRLGDLPGRDARRRRRAGSRPSSTCRSTTRHAHGAAPAGEARPRALRVPRRLRAVRRLPGRRARRGGGACRGTGIVALKLFTGGVAPPGMYPGADTGQILDCMRRAQAGGPDRRRALRERRDRRLRDGAAPGGGSQRGRGVGRGATVVQRGRGRAARRARRRGDRLPHRDRARDLPPSPST